MLQTVCHIPVTCLLCLSAGASGSVIPRQVRDLTADAQAIVVGDVVEVTSFWSATRDLINSRIVIEVDDYLLGKGSGTEV